jgi:hypothetical protein
MGVRSRRRSGEGASIGCARAAAIRGESEEDSNANRCGRGDGDRQPGREVSL